MVGGHFLWFFCFLNKNKNWSVNAAPVASLLVWQVKVRMAEMQAACLSAALSGLNEDDSPLFFSFPFSSLHPSKRANIFDVTVE